MSKIYHTIFTMSTFLLETERLIIRPFNLTDVDALAEISADPEVMRYITGGAQSYEHVKSRVITFIKNYQTNGYSLFALIEKKTSIFIGFCGLIDQQINGKVYVELGYRLAKSHWKKNIATEAALKVKDFAFNTLNLPEIISIIQPDNKASIRVAEKIGMVRKIETTLGTSPVIIYHQLNPTLITHTEYRRD